MNKTLSLVLLSLFVAGAALACVDPDPDQMGVYFDTGATEYCTFAPFGQVLDVYIVYTRPSLDHYVGFQFGLTIQGGNYLWIWQDSTLWLVPPELDNVGWFSHDKMIPTSITTVLVPCRIVVLDFQPITIYLHGARDGIVPQGELPVVFYVDDSGADPVWGAPLFTGVSGGVGQPTAQINGDCVVVDDESETWSGVKSLYR